MMAKNEIAFVLKRRRGLALLLAMFKTAPLHYKILRKHNSWWKSLYVAIRLASTETVRAR